MKKKNFQKFTADHVLELFKSGQKRVLVGDEAGLGKTTVAATVVRSVKDELKDEVINDDGLYCVVYVCCNLQIAQQNIGTICNSGVQVDLSQSRLSMQHFVYHKQKESLKKSDDKTLILSLTPSTSFKISSGMGSVHERALIYACLMLLDGINQSVSTCERLSDILKGNAEQSWVWIRDKYIGEVNEIAGDILASMQRYVPKILHICNTLQTERRKLINELRRIFALISLETMKPDLVIMDEFQKFSSLIDGSVESEESVIANKFFSRDDDKSPYILLLSATPYKPYTTLDEISLEKNDEQFEDFHRLMDFLNMNDPERTGAFRKVWTEYSAMLKRVSQIPHDQIISKHDEVENMLYGVMGRTERSNKDIIKVVMPDLSGYMTKEDITSYVQMRHLVDCCKKHGVTTVSAPVEYAKSCAYQLSFMESYLLRQKIEDAWGKVRMENPKIDRLLIDRDQIESRSLSDYGNARLAYVIDAIFGSEENGTGVENLLWVPASQPYYKQSHENVFTRNADFSKILVFSSWGMVPRMLSCLISYECERRAGMGNEYDHISEEVKPLLCTVSTWLAQQYDVEKHYNKDIEDIKAEIAAAVKTRIEEIAPDAPRAVRISSADLLQLLAALDTPQVGVRNIHERSAEILADIAVGSPAICLYRALKEIAPYEEKARATAKEVAEVLVTIFSNARGAAAVNNVSDREIYYQRVFDYCIKGNLQAVLDEFVHMIPSSEIDVVANRIKESFISVNNIKVNSLQTFGDSAVDDEKSFKMRKHFAIDLASEKTTDKTAQHAIDVRTAFNSPFRPFVLSSTSVGQEGLDFHWYSRKMIHWNLPSNPQNLEQREGRINRFKCHSVRRNIAKLYASDPDGEYIGWNEMFIRAEKELAVNDSGMIPFWYLPLDHEKFKGLEDRIEMIERIVPMYPMSGDVERYDNLIKVLSLYRLTMGQPRQEELVNMLAGTASQELIGKLIFNLSPYFRQKGKMKTGCKSEIYEKDY